MVLATGKKAERSVQAIQGGKTHLKAEVKTRWPHPPATLLQVTGPAWLFPEFES
jgi:hypothetical protein